MLPRFYKAYCEGLDDFVNGSRLMHLMKGEAILILNRLGNMLLAKTLSWMLDAVLCDSLRGTKLVTRHDYQRMIAWRRDFGDFGQFGDVELLFPTAVLALGNANMPVRYLARTYGSTYVHRFTHGWQLLKMTGIECFRIKLDFGPEAAVRIWCTYGRGGSASQSSRSR